MKFLTEQQKIKLCTWLHCLEISLKYWKDRCLRRCILHFLVIMIYILIGQKERKTHLGSWLNSLNTKSDTRTFRKMQQEGYLGTHHYTIVFYSRTLQMMLLSTMTLTWDTGNFILSCYSEEVRNWFPPCLFLVSTKPQCYRALDAFLWIARQNPCACWVNSS